jgi:hypothetical protein
MGYKKPAHYLDPGSPPKKTAKSRFVKASVTRERIRLILRSHTNAALHTFATRERKHGSTSIPDINGALRLLRVFVGTPHGKRRLGLTGGNALDFCIGAFEVVAGTVIAKTAV